MELTTNLNHKKSQQQNQRDKILEMYPKIAQTQKQLNKIFDILLDRTKINHQQVQQSLSSLFDLLLWAEKKNINTLQTIFNAQLLILIIQQHIFLVNQLVKGYILLLGNAMDNGPLINYLLKQGLPQRILNLYLQYLKKSENLQQEQHLHLLGSFLKAYHRHLTEQKLQYFVNNENCLLIEICCGFINCPEQITRTSIMNILMNIIKLPFINNILQYPKITQTITKWCQNMCKLFRNELKDFDQNLLITEQQESRYIIQSINDKIILWQDLSELGNNSLFSKAFYDQIIIPLVIGSLNTNGIPLFTLKFSLFILRKLTKTIANFDLINQFGSLLFLPKEILYKDNQLSTANLRPFTLKKLRQSPAVGEFEDNNEEQDENYFKNVNLLFMNILRSKDGRFLQCICNLLISLFTQVKKNPIFISFYIKNLGFGINGTIINQITQIIINQFIAFHPLEIIRIISSLLLFIQPTKYLIDDLKNRFLYIYKNHIDETISSIQKSKEVRTYLAEIFEYDAKIIASNLFNFQPQLKTDTALLFNNKIIQNQSLPFYQQLPQTNQNIIRYNIVKYLILRKISLKIIEQCSEDISLERYLQRIKLHDAKYIKPGQFLKLPIHCKSYRCKLVDNKIQIPNCLLIQDDTNFILGYVEDMTIKIIINIKLKHVTSQLYHKKDKIYMQFQMKKYDYQNNNDLISIQGIVLKHIGLDLQYFKLRRQKVIEYQMASIYDILKKGRQIIPQLSLI